MSAKKKQFIQFAIFAVTFAVTFFVARLIFSSNDYSKQLAGIADEMNKKTPVMIDAETRLDHIKSDGDTLQYEYTLINVSKNDDFDTNGATAFLTNRAQKNLDNAPEMKTYRENAISLKYYYRDKNGVDLLKFKINPSKEK